MHVAVNQTGRKRHPMGIYNAGRFVDIEVIFIAPRIDLAVDGNKTIPVKNRILHLAGQDHTDVAYDQFCHGTLPFIISIRIL